MNPWQTILWPQFGAAIDMLENAMRACPEDLWNRDPRFGHLTYHALFFLDLYLMGSLDGFAPPPPFTHDELDRNAPRPLYSQAQLQMYLDYCRAKGRDRISAMTLTEAFERCGFKWVDGTVAELHLYNMRHVQHHAAQLNLLLRQTIDSAPRWVFKAAS